MEKIYVANTFNTGKGIFAKIDIKKDDIIFKVNGKIIHDSYISDKNSEWEQKFGSRWLTVDKNKWISPNKNNPWRYINHSCDSNVGLKGKNIVVAMRNIKKDEELTIDYSITENDPSWKMICNCNQKECRKIIRSFKFLPKKILKRYDSYLSKFFEKRKGI